VAEGVPLGEGVTLAVAVWLGEVEGDGDGLGTEVKIYKADVDRVVPNAMSPLPRMHKPEVTPATAVYVHSRLPSAAKPYTFPPVVAT
jgi:hypothetical protein